MKNSKKLTDLTLEELQERKKKIAAPLIGIGIVLVIVCGILFYMAITKHMPALIAVSIGCLTTILPGFILLGQLQAEIKSRG